MTSTNSDLDLARLNERFASATPQELLAWAAEEFESSIKLACSLGAEDVALAHMASEIGFRGKVFVLDTGRLNEETHEVLNRLMHKFDLDFEIYSPQPNLVQELVSSKGPYSFRQSIENRKECCAIRKVEPLMRALSDSRAWVTGLRRDQSVTRLTLQPIETDSLQPDLMKINPLFNWNNEQVWEYIRQNKVPYNKLHDLGFPSIGCAPCTRAVKDKEDIRSGRWWWESPEHKECGLHRAG